MTSRYTAAFLKDKVPPGWGPSGGSGAPVRSAQEPGGSGPRRRPRSPGPTVSPRGLGTRGARPPAWASGRGFAAHRARAARSPDGITRRLRGQAGKWDAGSAAAAASPQGCPRGGPQGAARRRAAAPFTPACPLPASAAAVYAPGISIAVKSRKQCPLCGEMKVGRLKSRKGGAAGIRGPIGERKPSVKRRGLSLGLQRPGLGFAGPRGLPDSGQRPGRRPRPQPSARAPAPAPPDAPSPGLGNPGRARGRLRPPDAPPGPGLGAPGRRAGRPGLQGEGGGRPSTTVVTNSPLQPLGMLEKGNRTPPPPPPAPSDA